MSESVTAFVKQYGKLGALALEIANRMEYPVAPDYSLKEWKKFTQECGCAMCKQWHHGWSDKRVIELYRKLYWKQDF